MHILEQTKQNKNMSVRAFTKWLGIDHRTYQKIINGNIGNTLDVSVFMKINEKTGYDLCDLCPENPLCKLIKK